MSELFTQEPIEEIKGDVVHMVCGFLFRGQTILDATEVLLTQKNPRRVEMGWQRGLLNGIGGGVAEGETSLKAMQREAEEEANLTPARYARPWEYFATERGPGYATDFYRALAHDSYKAPEFNDARELLRWVRVSFGEGRGLIGNLRWLVPLAMDWRGVSAKIQTRVHIREKATW